MKHRGDSRERIRIAGLAAINFALLVLVAAIAAFATLGGLTQAESWLVFVAVAAAGGAATWCSLRMFGGHRPAALRLDPHEVMDGVCSHAREGTGPTSDATPGRNPEEALRRSEQRFRRLVENAWEAVVLVDQQGTVTYASDSVARVAGYTAERFVGKNILAIAHPDDRELVRAEFAKVLSGETHAAVKCRIRDARGGWRWVEGAGRNLLDDPSVRAIVGNFRDISERVEDEQRREELIRELERKNVELEQFTYTVSHDLKSPLITIRGFESLAERDLDDCNLERLRFDLVEIGRASDRMSELLSELLRLSRVGRVAMPTERIQVRELVDEALSMLDGSIRQTGAAVDVDTGDTVVVGDRLRLVEVLQNLVENALKFRGADPPRIEIRAHARNAEVICSVSDNGIGISPEFREKVFGIFEQLDPAIEGSGIGLTLVRRIVEVHHGRMWIESNDGGPGTRFCFALPQSCE